MQRKIQQGLEKLTQKIEELGKEIEQLVPHATVKEATAFGNSAHVVLSKAFIDKKVCVVVLGDKENS